MQKLVAKKSVNKNLEVWTLIFPQSDLRSEAMAISQGGDFFGPWSGPEKKKDFKGEGGFGRFPGESENGPGSHFWAKSPGGGIQRGEVRF